jgi:Family of unknown function (DUF6194)
VTNTIKISDVDAYIMDNLDGVVPQNAWGERAYFYNPARQFARGTYFLTIKQKDGENDRSSKLNALGDWRLNFGIERKTFTGIFGAPPRRPAKGCSIEGPWDFAEIDVLTPHPVYGWMAWLAVKNPSAATFEFCKPLIINAYEKARQTFSKRAKNT